MRINEISNDLQWILDKVKADCKPFLKEIGNDIDSYPLYRGVKISGNPEPMRRTQVRLDDRKPMSSSQEKHDRFNNYFNEKFGAPFRNSLHASGDELLASNYGSIFRVFPIGNFDWVWSPMVNDLALDVRWPSPGGWANVPPSQEVIDEKLNGLKYSFNTDIKGAIRSGNEIMIRCKECYLVDRDEFIW